MSKQYQFTHIHQPNLFASSEMADSVESFLDRLEDIFVSAEARREGIKNNRNLSIPGKQTEVKNLEIEIKKKSQGWVSSQVNFDKHIAQIEGSMTLTGPRPDDVVAALARWELRDALHKKDLLDVQNEYEEAAKNGNDLFVHAIETSPIKFKFPKENLIEEVRLTRLKRAHPEESEKLGDLTLAKELFHSALKSFEVDLGKKGLNVAPDSLADA